MLRLTKRKKLWETLLEEASQLSLQNRPPKMSRLKATAIHYFLRFSRLAGWFPCWFPRTHLCGFVQREQQFSTRGHLGMPGAIVGKRSSHLVGRGQGCYKIGTKYQQRRETQARESTELEKSGCHHSHVWLRCWQLAGGLSNPSRGLSSSSRLAPPPSIMVSEQCPKNSRVEATRFLEIWALEFTQGGLPHIHLAKVIHKVSQDSRQWRKRLHLCWASSKVTFKGVHIQGWEDSMTISLLQEVRLNMFQLEPHSSGDSSKPLVFKVWSLGLQRQHYLRTC